MNEVLKAVLIGIFSTIVAALNKVGERCQMYIYK